MAKEKGSSLLKEVDDFLKRSDGIDQVELLATDFSGNFFGKRFPIEHLRTFAKNGLTLPRAMYVLSGASASMPEYVGMGLEDGDPDFDVALAPGSLSYVNWGNHRRAQGLLAAVSTKHPVDSRAILAKVIDAYHNKGLTPVVAFELEFTFFAQERAADGTLKTAINPKTGNADETRMLNVERLEGFEEILDDIIANCDSQNIRTGAVCAEYGAGQFEINFPHYDDALRAADHAQLFKRTVKAVARKHGLIASFIAKPSLKRMGNGQHIHISVTDQTGTNIFDGGHRPTEALMHAVGGLQKAAREAMLLWAPNVNSYRRFEPESCVPLGATWAHEHRYVAFRIPTATAGAWRIENRAPGADANCYLTLASTLAGMLYGIENTILPSEETKGAPEREAASLPLDIRDAINATRNNKILGAYLGEDFLSLFTRHREGELHYLERHISLRELDWYV